MIVYALMMADVFAYLLQALAYQGIFVVAWVAVAVAHILSDRYDQLSGGTIEYRSSHVLPSILWALLHGSLQRRQASRCMFSAAAIPGSLRRQQLR